MQTMLRARLDACKNAMTYLQRPLLVRWYWWCALAIPTAKRAGHVAMGLLKQTVWRELGDVIQRYRNIAKLV